MVVARLNGRALQYESFSDSCYSQRDKRKHTAQKKRGRHCVVRDPHCCPHKERNSDWPDAEPLKSDQIPDRMKGTGS